MRTLLSIRRTGGSDGAPSDPAAKDGTIALPPTLCVDALGGLFARRWGAALRHLRLARLGRQTRLFVHLDPLLARNRRDQLANRWEGQIARRLEMNATLPHVELFPRRSEERRVGKECRS